MLITACSLFIAVIWTGFWSFAVVIWEGGVGVERGEERGKGTKEPSEPTVLTIEDSAMFGSNHAPITVAEYASHVTKDKVNSWKANH